MAKVWNTKIDDDDEYDEHHGGRRNSEGEEAIKVAPPMIEIKGFGLFRLHGINCIEEEFEMQVKTLTTEPRYGISINKGIPPSTYYPKVDIFVWYQTKELRDRALEAIKTSLESVGIEIF